MEFMGRGYNRYAWSSMLMSPYYYNVGVHWKGDDVAFCCSTAILCCPASAKRVWWAPQQ
jgi:hypothetical protein